MLYAPGKRTESLMQQVHAECGLSEGCIHARSICMYHSLYM